MWHNLQCSLTNYKFVYFHDSTPRVKTLIYQPLINQTFLTSPHKPNLLLFSKCSQQNLAHGISGPWQCFFFHFLHSGIDGKIIDRLDQWFFLGCKILPNFDLKNMTSTYTKGFILENLSKFTRFQRKTKKPNCQIFIISSSRQPRIQKDSDFIFFYSHIQFVAKFG